MKYGILGAMAAVLLLAMSSPASAQNPVTVGPITTSMKILWDALPGMSASEAQPLVYKMFDSRDNLPPSGPIQLTGVTCTALQGQPQPYLCQASVTQAIADLVNKVGQHAITLTVTHPTGGESSPSLPFSFRIPPAAPTGLRITP